jgi:DNA-binding transcriptional MerR regulator
MDAFTIKDLENLSGIKAHTIRVWEQRYKFLRPQRTATNIRYYSNEELKMVLNIALLNKYGFKISHIDRMPATEIQQKILSLGDPQAVQERIVNQLVQEMVDMNMDRFESVLKRYIAAKGIEQTVLQIIFPFLEKIGLLWQSGHINPAQEHLVTNVIRNKLIYAIETCEPQVKTTRTCLLYLPQGEHHELGLLFLNYLLKSRGARIIYLGANIPLADVRQVVSVHKPELSFVHLTATCPNFSFDRFLREIDTQLPSLQTVITGQMAQGYRKRVPANVQLRHSLSEVMEFIHGICC